MGPDAALRTPYGIWPGYLSLIELDFDRANEKAWGVGAKYNWTGTTFKDVNLANLSVLLFYAQGKDARTPDTGARLPTRHRGAISTSSGSHRGSRGCSSASVTYVGQEARSSTTTCPCSDI